MSTYTKTTSFGAKDNLADGDPEKIILGADFDTEFDALVVAVGSKADSSTPSFTGTLTTPNASASEVGFKGMPQNAQTANYTLVLADAGKHIHHASGAGAGDTYTLPANASVAYPLGTRIMFTNLDSNAVSIAITTDTLRLSPGGTTGTRTLAQYGTATALKVETTVWLIWGQGLT